MADEHPIELVPLTIYDTVHIEPGANVSEIAFRFGADASDDAAFNRLVVQPEAELTRALLNQGGLAADLFRLVDLVYPNVWTLIEPLTSRIAPSWREPSPGDLDIVCGAVVDGTPSLENISCFQVKIRRFRNGKTVGPTGRSQANDTARMGFDRTVLLHMLVKEPEPVSEAEAGSWNAIKNADFVRSVRATLGVMRKDMENDSLPFGYTIVGWGQAFGKEWNVCGGMSVDKIKDPPLRPFSSDAAVIRDEMRVQIGRVLDSLTKNQVPILIDLSRYR